MLKVAQRVRMVAAVTLSLAIFGTGCQHHASQAGIAQQRIDTLWYATSRQRSNNRLGYKLSDSIEYGFYRLASRANVDIMRDRIHMRVVDSAHVSETTFLAEVAAPSNDSNSVVVLQVHGYATDHRRAIDDASEAFLRSGSGARWVAFSWPSRGRGMNLMQPGRFSFTSAYHADSIAAVQSQTAFTQLLLKLHGAVGGSRLVVVAHSLGAQLATESLARDSTVRSLLLQNPLRAIGLFEPDVSAQRFAQYTVPKLRPVTRRFALYASTNDGMLRFSGIVNHGARAGLLGESTLAIDGVEIVDVTNAQSSEDWLRRRLGTHHAMKKETGALQDFFDIVVAGKKPTCRITNGTAALGADNLWHLLPARSRRSAC
ncbi:MAG: alpha/beta fold hydrolase [Gemmatimonadaceae bacterium]